MQNRVVSGNPFAALGIPMLAGRHFDDRDHATAPARVIVSENFARVAYPGFPNEDVVGQRLAAGREFEIIGIVGDVSLDVYGTPTMVVYRPHRQFANDRNWALTQVVASDRSADELLTAVRQEVARMNPELVVHRPMTMSEVMRRGAARERFALVLMATFAVIALALAALGIYGVLAYAVRQRTTEIGIRVALGATGGHVRALVLRQAGVVVGIGVVAGLAGALALGRWLEVLAFGITPSDPRLLLVSTVVLVGVAIIAAWIPARRAALVDPSIAMHEV
jgi:ABC-type antimicrobial peptide transport system permease subunit